MLLETVGKSFCNVATIYSLKLLVDVFSKGFASYSDLLYPVIFYIASIVALEGLSILNQFS